MKLENIEKFYEKMGIKPIKPMKKYNVWDTKPIRKGYRLTLEPDMEMDNTFFI